MISSQFVAAFLDHIRFVDIFVAYLSAALLFAWRCKKRAHFGRRAVICLLAARFVCLVFSLTSVRDTWQETAYTVILIPVMFAVLMLCYEEGFWNMCFYAGSGYITQYIADRTFLIAASFCRLNPVLSPYFVEDTLPHIVLYGGCYVAVYTVILYTVAYRVRQLSGPDIPVQNTIFLLLLVSILTPIFYYESRRMEGDLFFYNLLNFGELVFYFSMLYLQVLMLLSAKERTRFHAMEVLWQEEKKQYQLIKENVDAINIKCHDLKHQIQDLRKGAAIDPRYLEELEHSVMIYDSAVRTGNETLDVLLTNKTLHCTAHNIQFTCMVDGQKLEFMEVMDVFSLFGNILDNAMECEEQLAPEDRFIYLSVKSANQLLLIHAENCFPEQKLEMRDGLPVTTKRDKNTHGYGMLSIKRIVEKYAGNLLITVQDGAFQVDIMLPIPA